MGILGYCTSSEAQIKIRLAGIRLSCLATGTVAPRSTSTVPQKTQHPVGKASSVWGEKHHPSWKWPNNQQLSNLLHSCAWNFWHLNFFLIQALVNVTYCSLCIYCWISSYCRCGFIVKFRASSSGGRTNRPVTEGLAFPVLRHFTHTASWECHWMFGRNSLPPPVRTFGEKYC